MVHINDDIAKRLLRELSEERELKQKRKDHSYVEDLIHLLLQYKNGLSRRIVLNTLEQQRKADGLPIPVKFEESVQSSYNQNCSDSAVFKRKKLPDSEAPFYSPGGSGSGKWAVDIKRAENWLRKRRDSRRVDSDETGLLEAK